MTPGRPPPDVLALDFDGVLCEGAREYFESSRRACQRVWPDAPAPADGHFPAFRALRPVIERGWEMPLLLRAIALGTPPVAIEADWALVRDRMLAGEPGAGPVTADTLGRTLDDERRRWIAADTPGWLDRHAPYLTLDDLRRIVAGAGLTVIVTTKEGEFARRILAHWDVPVAGVEGKETGPHKCDNLRRLIAGRTATLGRRARLWFVEDRLETLEHVTTHADLADVGLFLAAWGYNTAATRARVRPGGPITLLELDRFQRGVAAWR